MNRSGSEVQFIDEHVHQPDRVLRADVILDAIRRKKGLVSLAPFDETVHPSPPVLKR